MQAVIMDAPRQARVGQWEARQPGEGEVLVRVRSVGVCAGDMYFYLGKNPYAVYPQVCGHEISGVVESLGEGVRGLSAGDHVVVEPFIGCGRCYACRIGKRNCCRRLQIIGIHRPGGFAEYVLAPAQNVHKIPESLPFERASLSEPIAIAVQASRRGQITAEDQVLVMGCGPIGLALIDVLSAKGAQVFATDINPARLDAASQLGARPLPGGEELPSRVSELTEGDGMPVVIEATGNPQAMRQAVDLVAPGGRVVIVGLVPQGVDVPMPGLDFTRKEMTILGSRASVNCFPEAIELLAGGKIRYADLATTFSLWDAPALFADWAQHPGSVQKAILRVD
ncbi:Alcohol dehydrogenase GroES domain protein [Thermobaculum terrenum ATCC BAA-798]|uniref:Alcohol dehydrogenase GroES domain protein n=1 Tax=Thermobaculum terrenum (strain ATCC BAA-798 / CCMEE 7001 / YNP1) TaxID=525904 RepID=D1CGP1_THET1|nr:zinc-binding alcohol dehydrogenase family protein [Thermobaculum terrenum]ACZ42912.1 Alcohol dehydrogenase GroES domain protein [Thermobaculum terrenum ATCC BAA-798]